MISNFHGSEFQISEFHKRLLDHHSRSATIKTLKPIQINLFRCCAHSAFVSTCLAFPCARFHKYCQNNGPAQGTNMTVTKSTKLQSMGNRKYTLPFVTKSAKG